MQTFILLTRLIREEVHPSFTLRATAKEISIKIKEHLATVEWIANYSVIGPWDYLDIFTAPDLETAMKLSVLVRYYGGAHTEVWSAVAWHDFDKTIQELTATIKDSSSLRKRLQHYWSSLSGDDLQQDREHLIQTMAEKLNVSTQVIEKEIGEWQAGKSA